MNRSLLARDMIKKNWLTVNSFFDDLELAVLLDNRFKLVQYLRRDFILAEEFFTNISVAFPDAYGFTCNNGALYIFRGENNAQNLNIIESIVEHVVPQGILKPFKIKKLNKRVEGLSSSELFLIFSFFDGSDFLLVVVPLSTILNLTAVAA